MLPGKGLNKELFTFIYSIMWLIINLIITKTKSVQHLDSRSLLKVLKENLRFFQLYKCCRFFLAHWFQGEVPSLSCYWIM